MEQKNAQNEKPAETICPICGLPVSAWSGQGFTRDGKIFCCEGCAKGTGCICLPRKEAKLDQPLSVSEQGQGIK